MLPLQARVDLGVMAMKGVLHIPKSSGISEASPSDCLVSYPRHLLGRSLSFTKSQLGCFSGLLQGDTLAPYLCRLCTSKVNRFNQRKWFPFKNKARSRQYPTVTMTDADYAENQVLLANTPAQAESLLHNGASSRRHWPLYECN